MPPSIAMPTIAAISTGVGAVGTAISAAGALASGEAQAASANYQAQVAQNNSIIANQNADAAAKAGQEKATEESLKGRERLGAVRAGAAASGLDVNSGSALAVQNTVRDTDELNTEQTVHNAAMTMYGYRIQGVNATADAQLEAAKAKQAPAAGAIAAAGDLLSGASSLGLKWQQLQKTGANGATGQIVGQTTPDQPFSTTAPPSNNDEIWSL